MVKLIILTILFISNFNFGAINEKLEKAIEIPKSIQTENVTKSENVVKKQENTKTETPKTTMVNTNTNTQSTTSVQNSNKASSNVTEEKTETSQVDIPQQDNTTNIPQCTGSNHIIETGNSNKWFDTEQEAINFFDEEQRKWGNMLINKEIDIDTYNKKCPYRL